MASADPIASQVIPQVLMAVLALLGLYAILELPFVRIEARRDVLVAHAPWRAPKVMRWKDVEKADHWPRVGCLVVRGRDGTTIHACELLSGIHDLHRVLLERIPSKHWTRRGEAFRRE